MQSASCNSMLHPTQELVAHAAGVRRSSGNGGGGLEACSSAALGGRNASGQRLLSPRDMLVLHLMHVVGAAASARLPAAESDQVSMLLEMLEGGWMLFA